MSERRNPRLDFKSNDPVGLTLCLSYIVGLSYVMDQICQSFDISADDPRFGMIFCAGMIGMIFENGLLYPPLSRLRDRHFSESSIFRRNIF